MTCYILIILQVKMYWNYVTYKLQLASCLIISDDFLIQVTFSKVKLPLKFVAPKTQRSHLTRQNSSQLQTHTV